MSLKINSHRDSSTLIPHIEITNGNNPKASIIWLHGLGADGNDFISITDKLLPEDFPIRFIFPHVPMQPVSINNGYIMRAWYDIVSLDKSAPIDEKGILQSVSQINSLILQEVSKQIPSNKIILGGFSQGSVIAMTTALKFVEPLGEIISLSGYLPNGKELVTQNKYKNTPVFIGHGTWDPVVSCEFSKISYELLKENAYPVTFNTYPMQHEVSATEIKDISKWLRKILIS